MKQKHSVTVTVSDPNHSAMSKRKETTQRKASVNADTREQAINSALAFYKKQGYKIHDHHYNGIVEESTSAENNNEPNFSDMDTATLKQWIATRQQNAMGGNLSEKRQRQYEQATKELKKRQEQKTNESHKPTFKEYLIESEQEHDLFVGRFQPFHKGHADIVSKMKNPIIAVVKGKGSSEDKQNNPLSFEQQKTLIHAVFPHASVIEVANANLYGMLFHLKNEGKKIETVFAGEDRVDSYKKAVEKSNKETGFKTVVEQTPRIASATSVRNAIRSDDFDEFKRLMPTQLSDEETFKMLRNTMEGVTNEGRESEYNAWSAMNARAEARRPESREEVEQRMLSNMKKSSELALHKKQLDMHKSALKKTAPGSTAHAIIKKKVDDHERRLKSMES